MMRQLVILAALLPALSAGAQEIPPVLPPARVSPAFGLHYGSPLRASAAIGVLVDRDATHNDGLIAVFEPGLQGNELSAGYFKMFGSFGSGFSVRAAVIRTRAEPWNATPRTTYIGGELHSMLVFGVGGHVGFFRRAASAINDDHDTLVSFGLSIGA